MSGEIPLHVYSDPNSHVNDVDNFSANKEFDMSRSAEMQYVTVTIPNELVTQTINALGDFGFIHVVDLSTSNEMSKHQFAYKKRTTEVADLEKKFKYFEDQIKFRGIPLEYEDYERPLGVFGDEVYGRNPDIVLGAAEYAEQFETQLNSNIAFERTVQNEIARRTEVRQVLLECDTLIPDNPSAGHHIDDLESGDRASVFDNYLSSIDGGNNSQPRANAYRADHGISSYILGVIPVENQYTFARLIHRTARGSNAIVKFSQTPTEFVDPASNEIVKKVVFCVVTIGSELFNRINKICPLVNATVYPVPVGQQNIINNELTRIDSEIREQEHALLQTQTSINAILQQLSAPRQIDDTWGPCILRAWQQVLLREKIMIDILMKCEIHSTLVYLGGWCPVDKLNQLSNVIEYASRGVGAKPALDRHAIPPKRLAEPPTLIESTKFTESFQAIINTYGFPKYGEFNPGLFTIVLFPFLFGVMFGDIGHGIMIVAVGLLLIIFEKPLLKASKQKTLNEMLDMVFSGRYCILLMGMFAIYCGTIYNDVMSLPLNLYGSNYEPITDASDPHLVLDYKWNGEVYSFGMDPNWYHKKNSLKFFNSFKMKIAVIIGVIQMIFGMFLSLYNHLYFNNILAIFTEFLPRLLFFTCLFGYMIAMIFIKWCKEWEKGLGPNLIQTMIDVFLSPGSVSEESRLYEGQETVQAILLIVAVIMIPLMLFAQPCIEHRKRQGQCQYLSWCHSPADDEYQKSLEVNAHHDIHALSPDSPNLAEELEEEEPHSFGDVMIHQSIHTIEFILGSVSNTASYLRLWALSLAHAQLAEVFWEKMAAEYGYDSSGPMAFVGTAVWLTATVGVIICMDGLECYLHALRLIWVEWNSKYYIGSGHPFRPFTFKPTD